jgi:hypothetical protein
MTNKEWRNLKEGDKVWVKTNYFAFPLLGVIKIRSRKKVVWLNLFGDGQFVFGERDECKKLSCLAVFHENKDAREDIDEAFGRRCCSCAFIRDARDREDGQFWCIRRKYSVSSIHSHFCQFWDERTPMKFKTWTKSKNGVAGWAKKLRNAQKTDVKAKHTNKTD